MKMPTRNWETEILAPAVDANILVFDAEAGQGVFTLKLVKLASQVMTDTYGHDLHCIMAPVEKSTLAMHNCPGVRLYHFPEIGKDNKYGKYLSETLKACRAGGDVEWAISMNETRDCFLLLSF